MESQLERRKCENGVNEFLITDYLDELGPALDDDDRLLLQETRDLIMQESNSVLSNVCFTVIGKAIRVQFYCGDENNKCSIHLDGTDKPKGHWRERVDYDSSDSSDDEVSSEDETEVKFPSIKWKDFENVKRIENSELERGYKFAVGRFQGSWKGNQVFIRQLLAIDDCELFKHDVSVLKALDHDHVITFHGICDDPPYVVTEFMENRSLSEFLKSNETTSLSDGIAMACQVASGMAYIGSKGYVHRDVAARSILVGKNNICKVGNFKMAGKLNKDGVYEMSADDIIPVKWTAREVLLEIKCTVKSDVWSFGILLSEIVTHGQLPYPGMVNAEVQKFVTNGYHMPRPEKCPRSLYDVMVTCWEPDPAERPTFEQMQVDLMALKL
ncbi:tyrosine-protein kinase SRK3-like [Glandiceps talaboti]